MHAKDYRLIAEHPLRNVMRSVIVDREDLPSKSQLHAAIDAAVPEGTPADVRDAMFVKAVELATLAEDRGARFDLRGSADRLVLKALRGLEDADRLVPKDDDQDTTPADVSGALETMDNWNPADKRMRQITSAQRDAELEANRIRQIRGQ